jgi:hypothetical protein
MSSAGDPLPRAEDGASARAALEAASTPVALTSGSYTVVASWLVDTYATRGGDLLLTNADGSQVRRRVLVRTNSTSGADATTCGVQSSGLGTHANLAERDWIDVDLDGAGGAQLARLKIKVGGTGWSATFVPDFLKAA